MSTRFDDYQRVLKNERFHRELQTAMMAGQSALMMNMSGALNSLQSEMVTVRQMHADGLAIQQEVLQREQFQGQVEEFIYNTEKMIEDFSAQNCEVLPSIRYFSLVGIAETVKQVGIGTAVIRGRDNKAAFESAMESVKGLLGQLKTHPEVIEAVQWAKAEQGRIADQNRQKEAKQAELQHKFNELNAQKQSITFSKWHELTFSDYLNKKPPYDNLPILKNLDGSLHRFVATILLWGPLPFGIYGCVWVPIYYALTKQRFERDINASIDAQIATVQQQYQAIQ
jgi:hypothetical protein